MSPMKERTMKTTELLATRFSLLQNTLQEQKPRVDSWDGSDDPSLDAIFYIFAFFFLQPASMQSTQCVVILTCLKSDLLTEERDVKCLLHATFLGMLC